MTTTSSRFRDLRSAPWALSASGLTIIADDPAQASINASSAVGTGAKPPKAPLSRVCHLCGTQQLLRSFGQHIKRCADTWTQEEDKKPVGQRRKRPEMPTLPDGTGPTNKTSVAQLAAFNRECMRVWKLQTLEQCPNCRRSFVPKSLHQHLKGCHGSEFLGASYVSVSASNVWHQPKTAHYPTLEESLAPDHRAVAVSSAGPFKLDPDRVELRRSVTQFFSGANHASSPEITTKKKPPLVTKKEPPLVTKKKKKEPAYQGFAWGVNHTSAAANRLKKARDDASAKTRANNGMESPQRSPGSSSSSGSRRREDDARQLEARLLALEEATLATHTSLRRIERRIMQQQPTTIPAVLVGPTPTPTPRRGAEGRYSVAGLTPTPTPPRRAGGRYTVDEPPPAGAPRFIVDFALEGRRRASDALRIEHNRVFKGEGQILAWPE